MQCSNCKTEISASFKHAFQKNECPACGMPLMDEESLKILEDIMSTILTEANIREETAHKLAMSIVSKYNISIGNNSYASVRVASPEPGVKIYPKQNIQMGISKRANVDEALREDVTDEERDKIFEEVLKNKYQDVAFSEGIAMGEYDPDLIGPNIDIDESMISRITGGAPIALPAVPNTSPFTEGAVNPYAEQKRQAELMRQRQNMASDPKCAIKRA